tara:strand:+ start:1111 stop:1635 length:525 start_codon:yes stop_codon:yes gene_type:complete
MKKLLLKSKFTKKLKKEDIESICKLKNTHWKYGLQSQINWFYKNMKDRDIHNLAYLKGKLVGYVSLRKRNFTLNNKKKRYLYFDTLIVLKKYRNFEIGHKLLNFTVKVIKKSKLHSMLICKKKVIKFYKKYKWKKIMQNKTKIIDHKYSKNLAMMSLNQTKQMSKVNIKYYIFS